MLDIGPESKEQTNCIS